MATSAIVSVDEYLRDPGKYEPDADYVDGEIQERAMGDDGHSAWQSAIEFWFRQHADAWNIRIRPELRVQITPTRFRIPDVAILDRATPKERIAKTPPVTVFEVLSPEDTLKRVKARLLDFANLGVPAIFLVDSDAGVFEQYEGGLLRPQTTFNLSGRGIRFDFSEIAALVD